MITEIKNAFARLISKPDTAKYRISEFEDRSIETIYLAYKKKIKCKKIKRILQ